MRIVYWVGIPVAAAICGAFAISNRLVVSLALWPLPFVVVLPLYLLVFAALLSGFVVGATAAWIGGRHRRRGLRDCRRRIGALERELAAVQPGNRDVPARPLPTGN
jgi:Lipopolysaccharide assembly protein A domain